MTSNMSIFVILGSSLIDRRTLGLISPSFRKAIRSPTALHSPPQFLRRTDKITQGPSMNITLDITPIHPQVHIILSPWRSFKHRYKATHCLSMEITALPPTLTSNLNPSQVLPTRSILQRHRPSMDSIASLLPLPAT